MAEPKLIEENEDDGCFQGVADRIALLVTDIEDDEKELKASAVNEPARHECYRLPWLFYNGLYAPVQRELSGKGEQLPATGYQVLPVDIRNMGIWNWQFRRYDEENGVVAETVNRRECLGTGVFIPRSDKYNPKRTQAESYKSRLSRANKQSWKLKS